MALGGNFSTGAERATDSLKSWCGELKTSATAERVSENMKSWCDQLRTSTTGYLPGRENVVPEDKDDDEDSSSDGEDGTFSFSGTKGVSARKFGIIALLVVVVFWHLKMDIHRLRAAAPCRGTASDWIQGDWPDVIVSTVDTSHCKFSSNSKPAYFPSLAGTGDEIGSTYGAASISNPKHNQFTIYIHFNNKHHLTPDKATVMIITFSGLPMWTSWLCWIGILMERHSDTGH
ncbi:unknown protein [Seminavis robusta]|uniref:Uncharacterized protein n=1 Tax=Seminavis robusta TaxID=568900 RepID=A0A9N8ECE0_9STRA|nr:unknown protein [Seminavis robusta]|eukprot:Sro796_g203721.1  (232) ;mRNA; r:18596-19291